jgi:uncharacterized RDD family membrane protein YckC
MTAQIEGTALRRPASVARTRARLQVIKTRAPFALRCGAILIDYIVLVSILVLGTLLARMLGGGARTAGTSTETAGLVAAVVVAVLNFAVLPAWRGQTIGKWAAGLRIERKDGRSIGLGRALVRHFIGYPLSLATLFLGFLIAIVSPRGRTLHDFLAGTVVIREEIVSDVR